MKESSKNSIEKVIEETVKTIEKCKNDIFDISENTRNENNNLENKLVELKELVISIIEKMEKIEKLEKLARKRLMQVSRNIKDFSEYDIKNAYDIASKLQAELQLLKEKESIFIKERTSLEMQYKRNLETLQKADQVGLQINTALDYLTADFRDVEDKLGDARENLGSRVIIAQENERKRIAREIHDGPAQTLAHTILRVELCEKLIENDVDEAKKELRTLKGQVRNELKDVRKIIYNLRPMALDDLGLVPTVSRCIEDLNSKGSGADIEFSCRGMGKRLPNTYEVAIFRVIQEAIQNIHKHSEAKEAVIDLEIKENELFLKIEDDGKGFDFEEVISDKERDGYGILGMKERIELLKGDFEIASKIDDGTHIYVKIPIKEF